MDNEFEKKHLAITNTNSDGMEYIVSRVVVKPFTMTFIPRDMMIEYATRGTYVRFRRTLKIRMDRFERLCRAIADTHETIDLNTLMDLARPHNEVLTLTERKE
ncbi:hypothetical protein YH66_11910 [[Brevibacterium] flavum]|uniref:Uncharacterized protein n=1 Tax=[Brevibacterium] flavum TaxID=92706 RepID=A0A0F6WRD7_9CORY|nr:MULTISPECIES: hypothetical protein [Corynebacterium]AKF28198.1 hypothetical protein YH66_11910 [[Brevibacterium] flavum]ANE09036.1 hypothetical protein A3654_11980 [Corynebacterium glutamicum]AST21446.1 hypothetical protein CEY17_12080 [Corynebacterium glutamicum ATCC 14067]KEI23974.1 hypothetical protein KIQ_015880 [Corynebacterium glutamicum ATCC 14067]KIH72993.1 hypothetical protein SD36_11965 [Corynebacterium glutamicum]